MKQVDNLLLERSLGKGTFGEVFYTTIQGETIPYATKVYDRELIEQNKDLFIYLKNEITIVKSLDLPNIVKLKEVKKTKKHFYIVMEYCNGGDLYNFLQKYQEKNKCSFSEEIVQYLMRQIMSAMHYLHSKNIIHRNIKLENILLQFDSEEDKNNLNIMKSQIKIIDFGFATNITLTTVEGKIWNITPLHPLLVKKLISHGRINKLGYDSKIDVWSLGSICYEMLIGKPAFDAEDMIELIKNIEKGDYQVPTHLSREVISFLNGMLQYDSEIRLSTEQLIKHRFLTDDINNFHKIDLEKVSDKIKNGVLELINKKNQSIWSIFNIEEELNKISPSQLNPYYDGDDTENIQQIHSLENKNNTNNSKLNIKSILTYDNSYYPKINNMNYFNQENNPDYGPILPPRDNSPIYINQKFEHEVSYSYATDDLYEFAEKTGHNNNKNN